LFQQDGAQALPKATNFFLVAKLFGPQSWHDGTIDDSEQAVANKHQVDVESTIRERRHLKLFRL